MSSSQQNRRDEFFRMMAAAGPLPSSGMASGVGKPAAEWAGELAELLRESWDIRGVPPFLEGAAMLEESLFSVAVPSAEALLDVSWTRSGAPQGLFVCSLVVDDEWAAPRDQLRTKNRADVRDWLLATLPMMAGIAGELPVVPEPSVESSPVSSNGLASAAGVQFRGAVTMAPADDVARAA